MSRQPHETTATVAAVILAGGASSRLGGTDKTRLPIAGATGTSYTDATSYLVILGGWKNTRHVLARMDEHGEDRFEVEVDPESDDERARPVAPGQVYRFRVERSDGRTVRWSVDGISYFELADPEPLAGRGHEHLGFNNWDAPVCFDNVRISPL